jgi:hypothetical protein
MKRSGSSWIAAIDGPSTAAYRYRSVGALVERHLICLVCERSIRQSASSPNLESTIRGPFVGMICVPAELPRSAPAAPILSSRCFDGRGSNERPKRSALPTGRLPALIPRTIMGRLPEALACGARRHCIPALPSLPLCGCLELVLQRQVARVPPRSPRRRYADAPRPPLFPAGAWLRYGFASNGGRSHWRCARTARPVWARANSEGRAFRLGCKYVL